MIAIVAIWRELELSDVLDVALVALAIFGGLQWLRRSAPKAIVAALAVLSLLLVASRLVDLRMTRFLLESVLVLAVVALVVVFQADIRRVFDRIAAWRWPQRGADQRSKVAETCAATALHCATERTGALIALRGREDWALHVPGGVELHGKTSQPLLLSLFHTQTPGHDGAVLIEGDRLVRFGVHLPLSSNLEELGARGTRHAAALGLSERCDALVVVVSEERGVISIAKEGRLTPVTSAADLEQRLSSHLEVVRGETSARSRRNVLFDIGAAAVSLGLAVGLWFVFARDTEPVARVFESSIEFRNVGPAFSLRSPPDKATVTLSGPAQAFARLDPAELVVSLDLAELGEGTHTLPVTAANVKAPTGLEVTDIEPTSLRVVVDRLVEIAVPIEPQTRGKLPERLELVALEPQPSRLPLLLPRDGEQRPIRTEPIDLSAIRATKTVRAVLVLPPGARRPPDHPTAVDVVVRVKERANGK